MRTGSTRLRTAGVLAGLAGLLAVACGTTLPADRFGETAARGGSPDGLQDGTLGLDPTSPQATGGLQPSSGAGGAAGAGRATVSGPGGAGPGSSAGGAASAPGSVGPGVTDKEIAIGISLFKVGAAGQSLGVDVSYGNTEKQAQAVVDWANANGGIAGRKVKPVYYTVDFGRAGQVSDGQFEQEACAKWTEDNKVLAAVNNTMARETLLTCLASRGVFGIHDALPVDVPTMDRYRLYYYNNAATTLDRRASFQVTALGRRGYFEGAVVGIMYYNDPAYKRIVDNIYIPLLKRYGAKDVKLQAAPRGGAQEAQTAVAQFQRDGVTHVTFFGEAGLYALFFSRAAENQLYRPKYFLNTDHQLLVLQSGAPPQQLVNSTVQGWLPSLDVDNARDPGIISPKQELCLQIERNAGQDMSERGARFTAELYCDGIFFLKHVLDAASSLTAAGVAAVVAGLGSSYVSPTTFATSFSNTRHDAPSAYRDAVYRCSSSTCDSGYFVYVGQTTPMP